MSTQELIDLLAAKFRSGNSIPVERVTVTRAEFDAVNVNATTREAWLVETNTDLTEGRGYNFPLHICDKEATALRLAKKAYVMGSDAPVSPVRLLKVGGAWYGPVSVRSESKEDAHMQKMIDARRAAETKAFAAGLTGDDINALRLRN